MKVLLWFRRLTAAFVLLSFVVLFAGFDVPSLRFLPQMQLVPAVMASNRTLVLVAEVLGRGIALLLTVALLVAPFVLFGRLYCAVLCPLGIVQDLFARLRSKQGQVRRFRPARNWNVVIFSVLVLASCFSNIALMVPLEPYSLFGFMAGHGCRYMASLLPFAELSPPNATTLSWLLASALFVFFFLFAWLRGRDWCGRFCPVGYVLGVVHRYALFQVRLDEARCTGCGKCERVCKTGCVQIEMKEGKKTASLDASRCVTCFSCAAGCPTGALRYGAKEKMEKSAPEEKPQKNTETVQETVLDAGPMPQEYAISRRNFLRVHAQTATGLAALTAYSGLAAQNAHAAEGEKRIAQSPPGSQSHRRFFWHCTGCQLCVAGCPNNALRPALLEYGATHIFLPRLDFSAGYCNYDCVRCGERCPSGAILPLTRLAKHEVQTGQVRFLKDLCVVTRNNEGCGACAEHCPTLAVKMVPYAGTGKAKGAALALPAVEPELCVGCGACEYACPVPEKAIYVQGLTTHKKARILPQTEEVREQIEDFGF